MLFVFSQPLKYWIQTAIMIGRQINFRNCVHCLKLSYVVHHTTASIMFCVYNRVQHPKCSQEQTPQITEQVQAHLIWTWSKETITCYTTKEMHQQQSNMCILSVMNDLNQ